MAEDILPYGVRWDYDRLNFRTIAADAPDLPENFAIVEADTPAQAADRLIRAVRKAPVNFAVWNRQVSDELQDYARRFARDVKNGNLLEGIRPGKADLLGAYISGYFNALARNIEGPDRALHQQLQHELTSLLGAIGKKFPKRSLDPSFVRGQSTDTHEFHLDGPADEWRETADPDHSDLYYHSSIRFICNYDGPPTCAAANEDAVFGRARALPTSPVQHYRGDLKAAFNTVWEMQPWAVGVIVNQRWPHPAVMHSGGISREPDRRASRLRMLVTVK